ncbi:MAG: DUF748 domain-containing protein [Balneolales bacterium]
MRKIFWVPLLVILILIGIRIALPYWVINIVNDTLQSMEGYSGSIHDVDLHLYRGAYSIDSLVVDKIEDNNPVPFLFIKEIDISVEWGALLNGAVVGEVELLAPEINFVAPHEDEGEFGSEIDWTEYLNELLPIHINRFAMLGGTIRYLDFNYDPEIDITLNNVDLKILNINNVEEPEGNLPSTISLNATSIGSGIMDIQAEANFLKQIPDIDLTLEFEQVNLPDLNEFLEAYANIDAERGEFNFYSEMMINDGIIEGYVKPIINDLKILNVDEGSALEVAWEGIVGFITEIFENQPNEQLATQIPLQGDLNDIDAGIYPAIWNIFRNAFVDSFSKEAIDEG